MIRASTRERYITGTPALSVPVDEDLADWHLATAFSGKKPLPIAGDNHPSTEHLENSRRWGGDVEAYLPLHAFLDGGEEVLATREARAGLHHGLGIHLAVARFGEVLQPRPSIRLPIRELIEDHIRHDCGRLPSLSDWYQNIQIMPWMFRGARARHAVCDLTRTARQNRCAA